MPVTLPPGRLRAGDETSCDWVNADENDDRNRRSRRLGSECRRSAAGCHDHGHLTANEIGRQRRQPIIMTLRPAVFDRHVPAFNEAGFPQALVETLHEIRDGVERHTVEKPDHRHRLLRARGERKTSRTSNERDEFAPSH